MGYKNTLVNYSTGGFPSDWALQPELMNPVSGAQMAGVGGLAEGNER